MAGRGAFLSVRFLFAAALAAAVGGCLFVSAEDPLRARALAFFVVAYAPLAAGFVLGARRSTLAETFLTAALLPLPGVAWFAAAGASVSDAFGLWLLSFSCAAFAGGLTRVLGMRALPILALLLGVLVGGAWFAPSLGLPALDRALLWGNPLAAAADLLSFDWIRDGELYFRSPSGEPLGYPDWRAYSAAALCGGAVLCGVSWIRARSPGEKP